MNKIKRHSLSSVGEADCNFAVFSALKRHKVKDEIKFSVCNKLISRGVEGSSSYEYSINGIGHITKEFVNCGNYTSDDIVGVSVNGDRKKRLSFDRKELLKAMEVGSTIIADCDYDVIRPFNIGERELAVFLITFDYVKENKSFCVESERSVWIPINKQNNKN